MSFLCVFRTTEESSPRVKPKFKTDTKFKDSERNTKLTEPAAAPDSKRKFSRPKVKFPKSKDKVNVWSKQKKAEVKKKEQVPCWLTVFVFCCGVSKEHQWYSLLGKGRMFILAVLSEATQITLQLQLIYFQCMWLHSSVPVSPRTCPLHLAHSTPDFAQTTGQERTPKDLAAGTQKPIQETKQYTTANELLQNKENAVVISLHTRK